MRHMNTNITAVSVSFLVILLLLANPFGFWMPLEWEYLAVAALAVVAAIFIGIVFLESTGDEREESLRDAAARSGYLAGILVLVSAIGVDALSGVPQDLWILGTLAAMVIARLATRMIIT